MDARKRERKGLLLSILLLSFGSAALAQAPEPEMLAELWRIGDACPLEYGSPEIPGCTYTSTTTFEIAIDISENSGVYSNWWIEGLDQNSSGQTFVLGPEDEQFASFAELWTNGSDFETEYHFMFGSGGTGIYEPQLRTIDDRDLKTTYFAEPLSGPYDLSGYEIDYFTVTVENVVAAQFELDGQTYTEWAARYVLRAWGRAATSVNHKPIVTLGPYGGFEGSPIQVTGSASDVDPGDTLTYGWTCIPTGDVDPGASCAIDDVTSLAPTVTCTDDGKFTLSFTASDGKASSTARNTLTIQNLWPTVSFGAPPDGALFEVNTIVSADVLFEDRGTNDTHSCVIDWGDVSDRYETECSQDIDLYGVTHTYTEAGVFRIAASVRDYDGGDGYIWKDVVVYDPSGDYVSGEGWILSPPGAYADNPVRTGKANFAFVSKYRKGANVPDGSTQFVFRAGDLWFQSSAYEWLVVSGSSRAQFKGTGTINGWPDFGFLLTVEDADGAPNAKDRFRIKIWNRNYPDQSKVVYDNGVAQEIGGGSIVIHTAAKK